MSAPIPNSIPSCFDYVPIVSPLVTLLHVRLSGPLRVRDSGDDGVSISEGIGVDVDRVGRLPGVVVGGLGVNEAESDHLLQRDSVDGPIDDLWRDVVPRCTSHSLHDPSLNLVCPRDEALVDGEEIARGVIG